MLVQFQDWVYTHPEQVLDIAQTDAKWTELWQCNNPGADFSGNEDWVASGWQRIAHPFAFPFCMVEYGMAELGVVQIMANSLKDYPQAVEQYQAG
jgi:oligoendopeptidase F